MPDASLIAFTQSLIRCRSLPGAEGPVAELVLAEMRALGFDEAWIDTDGNVIGIIRGDRPGPTLLLDAHTDTIGVTPGAPWQHDPFGAVVEDGAIYGLGAADMKGALAAMVYAASRVDRGRIAGRVVVSASVQEEVYEGAALRSVMEAVRPDYVVIGEATGLNLVRAGRGRAEISLETRGRPAHSSTPHLGRNAVHDMIRVIQVIERLPLVTQALLGSSVRALTDIISEPYPASCVVPTRCRVTYDQRLLAGDTVDSVLGAITGAPELAGIELKATIAVGEHRTYTGRVLRGAKFFAAWSIPEEHPYLQAAMRGLRSVGLDPEWRAYGFCTNAAYSAGTAGVPTVGFGPAREAYAHVIDERLEIDELLAAARGYQGIIDAVLA